MIMGDSSSVCIRLTRGWLHKQGVVFCAHSFIPFMGIFC